MEDKWLAWTKRLHAIASTGMHFGEGVYDRERYDEVARIARQMLAELGSTPIERINGLISDFAKGYSTPTIDVRGAVIEDGKILLVREKSDGLWTLPGGYAEVGISASENIVKEIWEEAGLRVGVRGLYGVFHKAKHAYDPDARDFYKLFFLCNRIESNAPIAGSEIADVGFFAPDRLPPLSRGRVIEKHIEAAFGFHADPERPAIFD
jgi:ADP-ribose pyrophosphatase YjhB (NUDIX family)